MPYIAGNKVVGRDNRVPGSVAGRENMTPGVAYPMPFREACYLGANKSVSGLTRSSSTATAACTGHGLSVGDIVRISGADQGAYNGHHRVAASANANEFTYTIHAEPDTTATGTIVANKVFGNLGD